MENRINYNVILHLIYMILLILLSNLAFADCTKQIKVLVYQQKALPSLFDFSQKKYIEGEKSINITCELYNQVKEGDTLEGEETQLNSRSLFSGGIVEKRYYKILEK